MEDRDWMGAAVAVIALLMTAGVWMWPSQHAAIHAPRHLSDARIEETRDHVAQWRAEARRWDEPGPAGQMLAAAR
ncbi:MAG TPA: hypothetical protein VL974_09770 [Magnetospirillum sp.]|jgi:hypothetical protein|nr:hypothetical protein [Magnetospirillum sp.]